ncbi:MAG: hypothetical protein JO040_04035 [Gemmatimonadetes bacterium]|nr:hypothetical protein [Gemmatimonadota bacterium]
MSERKGGRSGWTALLLLALAACGDAGAEPVKVQPLPPLKRPSMEARAGLPEVAGTWNFAGWLLPVSDTATRGQGLVSPGALVVQTQRMDSVAGAYVREGDRFPFVGEVRRGGIFSFVAFGADGAGSFVAGRVRRDTLWVELTSLSTAQAWSPGTRAAFVRGRVGPAPFVRFPPGTVIPRVADSLAAVAAHLRDSLRVQDSIRAAAQPVPAAPAPGVAAVPGAAPGTAVPPGTRAPGAVVPGAVPPGTVVRPGAPAAGVPQRPVPAPTQAAPLPRNPYPQAQVPPRAAPPQQQAQPKPQQAQPRPAPRKRPPPKAEPKPETPPESLPVQPPPDTTPKPTTPVIIP